MLKKMKQRLQATAEHHRNRSVETGADHDAVTDGDREISKQFEHTRALHEKLSGYVVYIHDLLQQFLGKVGTLFSDQGVLFISLYSCKEKENYRSP